MGIDRVGSDRVGIVSIPKNLKINKLLLIGLDPVGNDRVRYYRVRNDRVRNDSGLEMIVNPSSYHYLNSLLLEFYLRFTENTC